MHVSRRGFLKGISTAGAALALSRLPFAAVEPLAGSRAETIMWDSLRVDHFTDAVGVVGVSHELLADGGFLVPKEYMADLMAMIEDQRIMRG